ncbi:MAG: hypothetical protein IBX67_07355 [Dehalococcoidia bacterium]|nr:hypothetical protein [Dehalococcoidia bacterium]
MSRTLPALLIVAALVAGTVGCVLLPSGEIRTWHDLHAIRYNPSGQHRLVNDLDSASPGYERLAGPEANQGRGWRPIGTRASPFTGTFDGQGYEIRDLFIERPSEGDIGLFGEVAEGAVIQNAGVVNVTVTGWYAVGGVVGFNRGMVINCYATGHMSESPYGIGNTTVSNDGDMMGSREATAGNAYTPPSPKAGGSVGGLVGDNSGTVSNSYSNGSVTGSTGVGGLVGRNSGTVTHSHSAGNVTGHWGVGGLVGWNREGIVGDSYATATVTGPWAGGLVGDNNGTVRNSYSTGTVSGGNYVGGLVGNNKGIVRNCYSVGRVSGTERVGGLVGAHDTGGVLSSFWDVETSGMEESAGGTGKTTADMMDITTFTRWDIVAVGLGETDATYTWNIVDGQTYPFLSWEVV